MLQTVATDYRLTSDTSDYNGLPRLEITQTYGKITLIINNGLGRQNLDINDKRI